MPNLSNPGKSRHYKVRPLLICLATFLIGNSFIALASPLSVSTRQVQAQDSYQVERQYAGLLYPKRTSHLGFETSGIVKEINVQEGDVVSAGDLLMSLDLAMLDAQFESAEADVAAAKANLNAAQTAVKLSATTLKRFQTLASETLVSKQQLDELSQQFRVKQAQLLVSQTQVRKAQAGLTRAQVLLDKAVLKAPFNAIVQARNIDEGSIITPGTAALTLVESNKLEARIGIPQSMVSSVTVGQRFKFSANKQTVYGKLRSLLPTANQTTATITAIFDLETSQLFSGTLVELSLSTEVKAKGYWVPLTALAEGQRGLWSLLVIVHHGDSQTVESRLVEIIHRGEQAVYVQGTLNNGELIVDSGTGRIVPGQEVSVSESKQHQDVSGG